MYAVDVVVGGGRSGGGGGSTKVAGNKNGFGDFELDVEVLV